MLLFAVDGSSSDVLDGLTSSLGSNGAGLAVYLRGGQIALRCVLY